MNDNIEDIKLFEIIRSLSYSMDLISNTIVGHHKKVAYVALQLGREMELSNIDIKKLVISALIHDLGVFYLHQSFADLSFDSADNQHAEIGYILLQGIFPLEDVPEIIRYHHHHWEQESSEEIPLLSHILHIADRVAVIIEGKKNILDQKDVITNILKIYSGKYFFPKGVDNFLRIAEKESFWLDTISNSIIDKNIDSFFHIHGQDSINYQEVLNIGYIISSIIDFRSPFTATHSDGVSVVAAHLGEFCGYCEMDLKKFQIAGYLHDIGKLIVPPHILNKGGGLSAQEWNIMRTHTYYTYQALSSSSELNTINQWASYHHEKLNGEGYPFHLNGDNLSVGSRILSAADIFTAITEDRPYRKGMSFDKSRDLIEQLGESGELDKDILGIITENFAEFYELRAESQRNAMNYFNTFKVKIKDALGQEQS
ncbi:MAG: HD domain-containing protein [Spirochaetia bacterium]